jgi:hypothetical protein
VLPDAADGLLGGVADIVGDWGVAAVALPDGDGLPIAEDVEVFAVAYAIAGAG